MASTIVVQKRSMASGDAVERLRERRRVGIEPDAQHRPRRDQALARRSWKPIGRRRYRCGAHSSTVMAPVGQRSAASRTLSCSSSRRLLLEHVEVAVAAHLEHLRAHLHAAAGRCAHVEVDDDLHDAGPPGSRASRWSDSRARPLGRTVAVGLGRRGVDVAALGVGALVELAAGLVVDARVGVGLDRVRSAGSAPSVGRDPRRQVVGGEVADRGDRLVDGDGRRRCRSCGSATGVGAASATRSPTAATGASPAPAAATWPADRGRCGRRAPPSPCAAPPRRRRAAPRYPSRLIRRSFLRTRMARP